MSKKTLRERVGRWLNPGPKLPTHAQKQAVVREFARRYDLKYLVETGTCHGDMVAAMQGEFKKIISIELADQFYQEVCERFKDAPHIELIHGDSAIKLAEVVARLPDRALFWLDGHYSGGDTARGLQDTPINEELRAIFQPGQPDHVVLVDDARCFGTSPGYPTLPRLRELITTLRPGWRVEVADDCIRIFPG
ncbi:MAG TPA: hypothetical protein PKN95_00760 [Verrucomicrobiota bacterium]|nr:hypothetical protein [Verrucomicrobiota bacterium]HNT14538.1 hypothetical protein [Verrucomicrobiota bacterium]